MENCGGLEPKGSLGVDTCFFHSIWVFCFLFFNFLLVPVVLA